MTASPPRATAADFENIFRKVGIKPCAILFLDYDGTLAPFQVDRDRALPYPGVRERLETLLVEGRTRVVVVSGRAVDVVRRLLGLSVTPEIWGSHGRERYVPGRGTAAIPISSAISAAIAEIVRWGSVEGLAEHIETKPAGVAVHVRALAPERAAAVLRAARPVFAEVAARAAMELFPFDGGLELRDPAVTKARAVDAVLSEESSAAGVAVYLGDDLTDEDAFAALAGRGTSMLVRSTPRESRADFWIEPPADLLEFFDGWIAARQLAANENLP